MPNKPAWMDGDAWGEFNRIHPFPRCMVCGADQDLAVDHVVPRWQGGSDDLGNLQWLCRRCNSSKGPRNDLYWSQAFYFDLEHSIAQMRAAQREEAYEKVLHYCDWFTRPRSQISRRLYTLAWIVASGKTLAIPTLGFALNRIIRRDCGLAAPRVDRILVLCKEQAIRDQIADDLEREVTGKQIVAVPPSVGVLTSGDQLRAIPNSIDGFDIVVACIHQLWERNGQPRTDLEQILAHFPLIVFDEPHFANEQVLRIVEAATISLCFGLTGTPIKASGDLLRRCVLFSLYDYDSANLYDNSLKFASDSEDVWAELVEEIGISDAELMRGGDSFHTDKTDDPYYAKAIAPAKSVAERVVNYVYDCDSLCEGTRRVGAGMAALARHRPEGAMPSLVYPIHALIRVDTIQAAEVICDTLNHKFEADRERYPLEQGYQALVVRSDVEDDGSGSRSKGKKLTPDHPWMWSKRNGGSLSSDCARFLIVVGMGREGVNNPLCGVIGVGCSSTSIPEHVQRTIGRQARANTLPGEDGLLLVPPARLDSIKIITHAAFKNGPPIREALRFLCNMGDYLQGLATMEDLMKGWTPEIDAPDEEGTLTRRERVDIARIVGVWRQEGQELNRDWLVDQYGGDSEKRRQKVGGWVDDIQNNPDGSYERLTGFPLATELDLPSVTIVMREYPTTAPTDDDLIRFIQTHKPEFSDCILRLNDSRRFIVEFYKDHARQFHLGEIRSSVSIDQIRRQIAGETRNILGASYEGDTQLIYSLVGFAVKQTLGTAEPVKNGGKWDVPQCHVILTRPEIKSRVIGYVIDRLARKGLVPCLAAAFGVPQSEGTAWESE
jgi:hypothetical protein